MTQAPPDFRSLDGIDLHALEDPVPQPDAGGGRPFDLVIIGSGPAGQHAALTAAKNDARVAIVERDPLAGGVCLNTGTIPSKSLREAVLYLTGYRQRGYYGEKYRLKEKVKTGDLMARTSFVIRQERNDINEELVRNGVERIVGTGRVAGPHEVIVELGAHQTRLRTRNILVAVGTRPRTPKEIPFDDINVFDSDHVFGSENDLRPLPDSLTVLGAGVIGIEYASMFGALGIPVYLIDSRQNPLNFVDEEISALLYRQLESNGVKLLFGARYKDIKILGTPGDPQANVRVNLEEGDPVDANACLFALGRIALTEHIGLREVGVDMDDRGRIMVGDEYQTSVPSIYAAGDVIGFPALASTSAEQGRVAALRALGQTVDWHPSTLPYGIYTIPEISMVGKTETRLQQEGVRYYKGTALWRDTARGKILGDMTGALKLLFRTDTHTLEGVHIIGEGATELLHIGQAVMHFGGGPQYFTNTVFNYPTLAEAYKIAAYNALNRLAGRAFHTGPLTEQLAKAAHPPEYLTFSE